jgi:hypothetical protein
MNDINQIFGDCVVSRRLWPPKFPDLNPHGFCLWGKLKESVCKQPTHSVDELKDNILVKMSYITREEIHHVGGSFLEGVRLACKQTVTNL